MASRGARLLLNLGVKPPEQSNGGTSTAKVAKETGYESDSSFTGSEFNVLDPKWRDANNVKAKPKQPIVDYSDSPSSNTSTMSNVSHRSMSACRNILSALETKHAIKSSFGKQNVNNAQPSEPVVTSCSTSHAAGECQSSGKENEETTKKSLANQEFRPPRQKNRLLKGPQPALHKSRASKPSISADPVPIHLKGSESSTTSTTLHKAVDNVRSSPSVSPESVLPSDKSVSGVSQQTLPAKVKKEVKSQPRKPSLPPRQEIGPGDGSSLAVEELQHSLSPETLTAGDSTPIHLGTESSTKSTSFKEAVGNAPSSPSVPLESVLPSDDSVSGLSQQNVPVKKKKEIKSSRASRKPFLPPRRKIRSRDSSPLVVELQQPLSPKPLNAGDSTPIHLGTESSTKSTGFKEAVGNAPSSPSVPLESVLPSDDSVSGVCQRTLPVVVKNRIKTPRASKPFISPRQEIRSAEGPSPPAAQKLPSPKPLQDVGFGSLKANESDLVGNGKSGNRKSLYATIRERNLRENATILASLKKPADQQHKERTESRTSAPKKRQQKDSRTTSHFSTPEKMQDTDPFLDSPSKNLRQRRASPMAGSSDRVLRTRKVKPSQVSRADSELSGINELDEDYAISDEENSNEEQSNKNTSEDILAVWDRELESERVNAEEDKADSPVEEDNGTDSADLYSDNEFQTPVRSKNKKGRRKMARERGQAYTTGKGKEVKARKRQQLPDCRMKCKEKIPDIDLDAVFEEYWASGSTNGRWQYVADRIEVMEKKCSVARSLDDDKKKKPRNMTQYYSLFIRGKKIPVCKKCFMAVLNETDRFVRTAVEKKMSQVSGVTPDDSRGKAAPANKFDNQVKEDIKKHINSYPRYRSHYSRRHTDKYYLGANLTVASMHETFNETAERKVSYISYYRVFQELGYKFKEPSLDTCNTCDKLQSTLQFGATEEEREEARKMKEDHVEAADFAYSVKKADKEMAKNNKDGNLIVVTFDLEQCLPTPALTASSVFYLRQLWTYNLTVHDVKDGKTKAYMWAEPDGGRGADQVASCIFTYVQENATEMVTHIILWSDQCSGQNKNSHMACMFMFLIKQRPTLQTVDHKFLVSGHTRMECDSNHSLVERKKKKWTAPIHHPRDWFTLVGSCSKKMLVREMKNSDFMQFSNLMTGPMVCASSRTQNTSGEKYLWGDAQWLRYKKNDFGLIHYKISLKEEEPFKTFSLRRKTGPNKYRNELEIYSVPKSYDGPCAIAVEKKEDLLKMMHLIDPLYRPYYENLLTDASIDANLDPDLRRSESDEEDNNF